MTNAAFAYGDVVAPLTIDTTNNLLTDADPALAAVLHFVAWGIETYIGPRLIAQARLCSVPLKLKRAVERKISADPIPFLFSTDFQFPMLSICRKHDRWDEHTSAFDKVTSEWELAYVLPSMPPKDQAAINPILRAVSGVVRHLLQKGDPNYPAGATALRDAGIMYALLKEARYGSFQRIDGPTEFYRAVTATLIVLEREMPVEPDSPFFSADVSIDVQDPDGTTVTDVVQASVELAPTFTGISPNSGTKQGGTTVTLTGTGFIPGTTPRVNIGGVDCTDVNVLSASTVRAVTAPHAAYATYMADVILTNIDGQSVREPAAFTFTSP